MIRFVDLTDTGETPACALLNNSTDRFVSIESGDIFFSLEEVEEHPDADRLLGLMPRGFFEQVNCMNKYRFRWMNGKINEGPGRDAVDALHGLAIALACPPHSITRR